MKMKIARTADDRRDGMRVLWSSGGSRTAVLELGARRLAVAMSSLMISGFEFLVTQRWTDKDGNFAIPIAVDARWPLTLRAFKRTKEGREFQAKEVGLAPGDGGLRLMLDPMD